MCVISRYGSIAEIRQHHVPPKFSALMEGIGVRGFYIIMRARRERVNLFDEKNIYVFFDGLNIYIFINKIILFCFLYILIS